MSMMRVVESEWHALDLGGGHELPGGRPHHGGEFDFPRRHHFEHLGIGTRNAGIVGMDRNFHRTAGFAAHFLPEVYEERVLVALLGLVVELLRHVCISTYSALMFASRTTRSQRA